MKVEKSIADFIQKTVKEIQSGLPDGYELTDEISFDISVVTTESDKGKIDIKIASFGMEGGNQSEQRKSNGKQKLKKTVATGVNRLRRPDNAMIIITHYQRLLDYIVPDFVHVLSAGRIVKSGDKTLAYELEEKGYDWIKEENQE